MSSGNQTQKFTPWQTLHWLFSPVPSIFLFLFRHRVVFGDGWPPTQDPPAAAPLSPVLGVTGMLPPSPVLHVPSAVLLLPVFY